MRRQGIQQEYDDREAVRSRRRVVLVSTEKGWHGGEVQAELLAKGLRQRGHLCRLVARRDSPLAIRLQSAGFEVDCFRGRGRNPLAAYHLRRLLARWRADILHCNDAQSLTLGGAAAWGLPTEVVASRRVDFPIRFPARYRRAAQRVICVSAAVARVCRQSGLPAELLRVVHDGVDPQRVASGLGSRARRQLGLDDQTPLLLSVGNLTDHKGHTFLIQAMPHVLRQHPNAVLLLAGDGSLREALEAEAAEHHLSPSQVRFLGYRDDVPDLLQAADLFVMPSHLEGLGSSVIDAMFANCPLVTTNAGGLAELIESPLFAEDASLPGTAGECPRAWTVPTRNATALSAAIIQALSNPLERQRRATKARQHALQRFTCAHMVDATLDVYEELLSPGRSSPNSSHALDYGPPDGTTLPLQSETPTMSEFAADRSSGASPDDGTHEALKLDARSDACPDSRQPVRATGPWHSAADDAPNFLDKPVEPASTEKGLDENTTPGTHDAVANWLFAQPEIRRVLDVPCGEGAFARRCREQGLEVLGGDCEPLMQDPAIPFQALDMNAPLPLEDQSLDAVVSIDGIEHLERPYDFVEEAGRVLRPGGWLVISTPNISSLRSRWRWLLTGFHNKCKVPLDETSPNPLHHVNMLSFPKLRYMLHRSGFEIERIATNRCKLIGYGYGWLAPLSYLATRWVFAAEEPDPAQRLRNREILQQLHCREVLFGETLILMARRSRPAAVRGKVPRRTSTRDNLASPPSTANHA